MSEVAIRVCPPSLHQAALELVMQGIEPSQRAKVVELLRPLAEEGVNVFAGLVIAQRDELLLGASWLQPQVGRTATLWPPVFLDDRDESLRLPLAQAALDAAGRMPVGLVQTLLDRHDDPFASVLEKLDFIMLAELAYMMLAVPNRCKSPEEPGLEFKSATENPRLLQQITQATYVETLDCPKLGGRRAMADTLAGYRSIGNHDPSLWSIVYWQQEPVGVLLLAPYLEVRQWELVYMGIVPEARGQSLGGKILREMQFRASTSHVDHVVLAVDASNHPAMAMYSQCGFVSWTRRIAYIKSIEAVD